MGARVPLPASRERQALLGQRFGVGLLAVYGVHRRGGELKGSRPGRTSSIRPFVARLEIERVKPLIPFTRVVTLAAIDRHVARQGPRTSAVLSSADHPPHIETPHS